MSDLTQVKKEIAKSVMRSFGVDGRPRDGVEFDITPLVGMIFNQLTEKFDIRERATTPSRAREPQRGQTWRTKNSNRLVRIEDITRVNGGHRIQWHALTGVGKTDGSVYLGYWTARFEYVEG